MHSNNNKTMLSKDHVIYDRPHKIRPLVDYLNDKFSNIPCLQDLVLGKQLKII